MEDQEKKVWRLISKLDVCMLSTLSGNSIRSRPMSAMARPEYGDIVMLTDSHLDKDNEIMRNRHVNLAYSDGGTYVSVEGTAEIEHDRALIRECWSAGAQLFWPNGPEDPSIVAIIVTPEMVEYWDSDNKFIAGLKFAYGLATHTTPFMGEHKRLRL
ncbi:pyridoxamine 5'-phosphate oxidase family protein [Aestuariivirga litoralis]|uniref:pyridoxamine 5'-phosphate oxidase family protein n=1 Tax=Aestuariivirga litoralis TaxID=2650924 RepID=UPI0018C7BAAA|nr:pyridoxamine 5'-phosphate oxidase family protein [Aestuariivirga litoralis]MBG1232411.1 general stress protein [Aestuariivirga litoralis]